MYKVSKRMEIAACHNLKLDYESKCESMHGHNWIITVHCASESLDDNGMVVDFTNVKKAVHGFLDHKYLNDILDFNPTAENIAKWVVDNVHNCYKATVQESEGNIAEYEK